MAEWGESRSIAAIEFSIRQNYEGLYEETKTGGRNPYDKDQQMMTEINEIMEGLK